MTNKIYIFALFIVIQFPYNNSFYIKKEKKMINDNILLVILNELTIIYFIVTFHS